METTRASLLVGYTGGKPYLQLVDIDATHVVSLATPLDGRDYAVDHAYARDGYVVLHSGTDLAISVPSDLRSGAARLGSGWTLVPAADPALVWLWQPDRNRDTSVEREAPSTCVLVDGAGVERDRLVLPAGYRLEGDTAQGLVVRGDASVGVWDRANASFERARSGRDSVVHRDGVVLLSGDDGASVWDLTSDEVRSMVLPPGVEEPDFPELAPSSTLVAWPSGRYVRGADVRVVIADLSTAMVVAAVPVDLQYLGSLCWSHDARWLYATFWDEPIIRCFSADGSIVEDVRFTRKLGNLLCDLGPAWTPPTTNRIVVDYDGAAAGRLARTSPEKSLRTAASAVLRDELGRSVAKAVMDLARPAVRLVPDDSGRSRIGGRPVLSSRAMWPERDGSLLSLLAHVDLAEVRRAWRASPFPPTGSLEFFYGPLGEDGPVDDHAAVLHVTDGSQDAEEESRISFAAVPVRPQLVLTLPVELDDVVGEEAAARVRDIFAEFFAGASGAWHQMGGHPGWIQGGMPGELLLQVDCDSEAGMEWGDGGRVFFVLAESALAAADFTDVQAIEECY